jgi:PPOX class probable F420-dependent enzyme
MRIDRTAAVDRFAGARVARMATMSAAGQPHVVPVTFAVHDNVVVSAVDDKPKSTRRLQRLENIRRDPRVALLVDEYDEDWSNLWWVRADGHARVIEAGSDLVASVAWLTEKYEQYRQGPPLGPVVWVDVDTVTGWAASAS